MKSNSINKVDIETQSQDLGYVTKAPEFITGASVKALDWRTNYQDPMRFSTAKDIERLFHEISKQDDVSDIVIRPDFPICLKVKRRGLKAITHRIMDSGECETIVRLLTANNSILNTIRAGDPSSGLAKMLESTEEGKAIFTNSGARSKLRYRYEVTGCASPKSENSFSVILRPMPADPIPFNVLGLSETFVLNCIVKDGTVIIAGATGEGKSTTLSSIIRYILEYDTMIKGIILTHEDPIEVSYDNIRSEHSMVIQSGIGPGSHIKSFPDANRSAMRRSPDLVMVGELRDGPTVDSAVELSLTGHPVFATTHANNVNAILPRLISRFPKDVQVQKAYDIIETSRMLVAQKLIWGTNGKKFAIREVLQMTPSLRASLLDLLNQTGKVDSIFKRISEIMQNGEHGSMSYEAQGQALLKAGMIDLENYRYLVEVIEDDNEIISDEPEFEPEPELRSDDIEDAEIVSQARSITHEKTGMVD